MVSKEQFVKDMVDLQSKRRKHKESDYAGYVKETIVSKKRKWNVKLGGYRW